MVSWLLAAQSSESYALCQVMNALVLQHTTRYIWDRIQEWIWRKKKKQLTWVIYSDWVWPKQNYPWTRENNVNSVGRIFEYICIFEYLLLNDGYSNTNIKNFSKRIYSNIRKFPERYLNIFDIRIFKYFWWQKINVLFVKMVH